INPSDKSPCPPVIGSLRPFDQPADGFHRGLGAGPNRLNPLPVRPLLLKEKTIGANSKFAEIDLRSRQRFLVDHGQPKAVLISMRTPWPLITVCREMAVPTDDAAKVSAPIGRAFARARFRVNKSKSHQCVVGCEVRPLLPARLSHKLPTPLS